MISQACFSKYVTNSLNASSRRPRYFPGRQGLLFRRVGALLATGVQDSGGRYPTRERPAGVAGEGPAVGRRQEAAHRGGDLAAQGLFRAGASSSQNLERTADSSGGQSGSL